MWTFIGKIIDVVDVYTTIDMFYCFTGVNKVGVFVLDKALTALVSVLFEVFPPPTVGGVVRSPSVTYTEEKTDQMDMDAPP